jgi:putative membrane protein insertion efficiency factor
MALIRAYQRFVSPSLGRNCRFSPTCSAYAIEAVGRYGTIRGTGMALKRLARCQPLVEGGYDPVPERI